MAKFFAPKGLSQVDITGAQSGRQRTIKRDKQGFFIAESAADAKTLRDSGFGEASAMGVAIGGSSFVCKGCGFNGFFAVCGKCGVNNKVATADVEKVINDGCDDCDCDGCDVSE
jgi:hypothetical protein